MSRVTMKYWRIKISAYKFLTENVIRGVVSTYQNESRYSQLVRTLLEIFSKADTLAKSFLKVDCPLRLDKFSPNDLVGLDKEKVNIILLIFLLLLVLWLNLRSLYYCSFENWKVKRKKMLILPPLIGYQMRRVLIFLLCGKPIKIFLNFLVMYMKAL